MLSSLFLLTFATALTIESFSIDKSVHLNYPEKASKSIRDKSTFTLKLSAPAEQVFLALVNPTNPDSTTTFAFSSTSGSSYSFVLVLLFNLGS